MLPSALRGRSAPRAARPRSSWLDRRWPCEYLRPSARCLRAGPAFAQLGHRRLPRFHDLRGRRRQQPFRQHPVSGGGARRRKQLERGPDPADPNHRRTNVWDREKPRPGGPCRPTGSPSAPARVRSTRFPAAPRRAVCPRDRAGSPARRIPPEEPATTTARAPPRRWPAPRSQRPPSRSPAARCRVAVSGPRWPRVPPASVPIARDIRLAGMRFEWALESLQF